MNAVGGHEKSQEKGLESSKSDVGRDEQSRGGTGGEDARPEVLQKKAHN